MSQTSRLRSSSAPVFAALGSTTRLQLLSRLSDGNEHSISTLSDNLQPTRQAITKHLRVLQKAGVVVCRRVGRESRYTIQPDAIIQAGDYLKMVSDQWDMSIARLRKAVSK